MSRIIDAVFPIIRSVRPILMPLYGKAEELHRKDGDNVHSAVTALDQEVESYLDDRLKSFDTTIGFVGEEHGGDRNQERFWLCDPIDGTAHYIRGMPYCTVMLALIEANQVRFGAIYDFVNDIVYHAERGEGAFANGERIRVSSRGLKDAYMICETHRRKPENMEIVKKLYANTAMMETLNAGTEHVRVASGKLEARVNYDPWGSDYDYAPGSIIVQEAGGIVANIGKRTYDYRNLDYIAANPQTFKDLTEGPDAIFPILE